MTNHKLKAQERKITGRKVKNLRKEGLLPANIYGKKTKSLSVQVDTKEFGKVFAETGETGLIDLVVGGKTRSVLISNVQVDPVTDIPIHIDFMQVDLKEKVTAQVPIEIVGESPAEKQGLGTIVQQLLELEVEALPMNLPEKFEIDVSKLGEVDSSIVVGDIAKDSKVEIRTNDEQLIVKVEPLRAEEEEPAPVEDEEVAEEGESEEVAEGEGDKKEEGDRPDAKPEEKDTKDSSDKEDKK